MKRRNIRHGLLALPALTALGAGYLLPLGIAFYKSFFAGMSANFAGLKNYTDLFGSYAFGLAVRNLLRLWCIAVPLNLVFGVLLAVLCVEAAGPRLRLPLIARGLALCVVLVIFNGYRCFREAYLIGGEHPHEALYSLQNFLQNNFSNMNYARLEAASILVVLAVFAAGLALLAVWKGTRRRGRP